MSNKPPDSLSLPAFLKHLTTFNNSKSKLTMSQAISAATKLYGPTKGSPTELNLLLKSDLKDLDLDEEIIIGIMKLIGGTNTKGKGKSTSTTSTNGKKRSRGSDLDRPLPTSEVELIVESDLDFEEILYEEALMLKSCVVNRAPVMSAWAFIVSERLGFSREEALSIAQVFTNLNATTKGISLGIFSPDEAELEPGQSAQPFVELMGRKVPVLATSTGSYRAISKGIIAKPAQAFNYISNAFKQQKGAVIGALRLLAESYSPDELNKIGYGLYLDFRPESDGWGKKAKMEMKSILDCRKLKVEGENELPVEVKDESKEEVEEVKEEDVEEEIEVVVGKKRKEEEGSDNEAEILRAKKRSRGKKEDQDDSMDEFDKELEDDLDWDKFD